MRVTDMRGVDVERYTFDFDLTFAALFMHPDGHVYHRYGGRDHRSSDRWLNLESFARLARETLREHAEYSKAPSLPEQRSARPLEDIPAFARRDKGECIHCHSVFPALYEDARENERWSPEEMWVYPPPSRIGLDLEAQEQNRISAVVAGSPAAQARLQVGDRLIRVGDTPVLSVSDLQWVLHESSPAPGALEVAFEREGKRHDTTLPLGAGWKEGDPLTFSWRPFKWGFTPAPGFGGQLLSVDEKRELGLQQDAFAMRVGYLVTWGDNARYGRAAARAGLRKGDVVLGLAGKKDFVSPDHFHAWWRLTRKPGETVAIELLRGTTRKDIRLEVLPDPQ